MNGGMGQQQQMPSTAPPLTHVAYHQQPVIGGGVGQGQQYLQQQPPQQTFMPGVPMQQQPHVNPMVQNLGMQPRYPSGYMVPAPTMGMAYMPVHANTYPVVNPSDNRQQASQHQGINAQKIGEYANAAVKVTGAAMKIMHMFEDKKGADGGSGGGGDGNSGFLGGLLDGNNGGTDNSLFD